MLQVNFFKPFFDIIWSLMNDMLGKYEQMFPAMISLIRETVYTTIYA